jgi:DNA primase
VQVPRLHPDTIEEVQQRVDIVDVISEYVVLRKRGKDYLGLCPFHDEKTPSFSVSQDKQVYYCFGCAQGGNTFKFLMEIGKQSFPEVVLDLARRYQIPVKTVEPEHKQEIQRQITLREQLYEILAITASFYQHALTSPQGEIALNYLQQERKLKRETIEHFQLGYAPAGWETLYRYLIEQKRYPVNLVIEAGLIKQRKSSDGYYDIFRDRLMIPICDTQNRVIGFGSRILNPEEQPKYLNSPETPLFNKSKTLFALGLARTSISKEDRAVVVEGYFDAIALHEVGIENVVASLGTAFTSDQLKQLLRYTPSKQVILNFDRDNAGIKATERTIKDIEDLIYGGLVKLRILNLPEEKDADEFLRSRENGAEIYHSLLDNAPLWLDWQIDRLVADKNLKAADDLQTVATGIISLLNRLQDINQRNYYLDYCAELLSQGNHQLKLSNVENLKSQLKSLDKRLDKSMISQKLANRNRTKQLVFNIANNPETELLEQAESLLLRIYLHCPRYRQEIVDRLEDRDLLFNLDHHRFLWQQIIELETELYKNELGSIDDERKNLLFKNNTLLTQLHNRSLEFSKQMTSITKLFYLDEKTEEDIFRTEINIDRAISSMELVACLQKRIYCTKILPNLEDSQSKADCYQEIIDLNHKIQKLERLRLSLEQNLDC